MSSPQTLFQRTAIAAALASLFPASAPAANVARVDFSVGDVVAVGPDGRSRPLARGSEINEGDTVNTRQGRAQLRFVDGAYMSLQPATEFKVEQFRYSGKEDGSENILMNLIKGGMRTITGAIGRVNRQNYRLRTEVATIGIRGTEYSVQYTNSIEVFCAGGSISIENPAGTLVISGGQGGSVQNVNTAPRRTEERPFLPPQAGTSRQQQQEQQQEPAEPSLNIVTETVFTETVAQRPLTGTVSPANSAVSLQGYSIRVDVGNSITLDAGGALTSFTSSPPVEGPQQFFSTVTSGTATATSLGNDGIIAWGRWTGGTTGGDDFDLSNRNLDGNPYGPLHYVVGTPATNLPTGIGTYGLMGYSASCTGGGCSSISVDSSALKVDFDVKTVLWSMQVSINGTMAGTYKLIEPAGPNGSFCGSSFAASGNLQRISGTGPFCSGFLAGAGFLAGDQAVRAGIAWHGGVFGGGSTDFYGANAYKKQ